MTNKKKIILFLGAVSLVAFGNYRQFIDNNKGKTTVEGKASEKATSSAGRNSKESKASEKATSSKGGKTVEKTVPPAKNNQNKANPEDKKPVAEAKSVQQTNKPVMHRKNFQMKQEIKRLIIVRIKKIILKIQKKYSKMKKGN